MLVSSLWSCRAEGIRRPRGDSRESRHVASGRDRGRAQGLPARGESHLAQERSPDVVVAFSMQSSLASQTPSPSASAAQAWENTTAV